MTEDRGETEGGRERRTFGGALVLPQEVKVDAQLPGVLFPVPNQELLSWRYGLAAAVKDLPLVLEGHHVLFFFIAGTVHVSERESERGGGTKKREREEKGH